MSLRGRLWAKGPRYWATALVILLFAVSGSPYVYDYLGLSVGRSYWFQYLLDLGRPVEVKFVRIVLIEDDEYWSGYPAGRSPIKRDYLAKIIDKLVGANVHIIALDIDTRLPDPNSTTIPSDYKEETTALMRAIESAATQGKKIVLATPISFNATGQYVRDADIYQAYGLCTDQPSTFAWRNSSTESAELLQSNVTCGYISLPYDQLVIPGPIKMGNGSYLDSFALAVARAQQPALISRLTGRMNDNTRYGNYISEAKFRRSNYILSAREVLQGRVHQELQASAVILGEHWSIFAAKRGPPVDLHWTPAGITVGAVLHANFVEAILDSRMFAGTPKWILLTVEISLSLFAAVVFALTPSIWGKVASLTAVVGCLVFVQWVILHGFGVFVDLFVPVLGLGLHSLYERLIGDEERTLEPQKAVLEYSPRDHATALD